MPSSTVAILDGERVLRDALVQLCIARGFRVPIATGDPQRFLSAIRHLPADLALVDLDLGDPGSAEPAGLFVLRALAQSAPQTRALALSTSADPEDAERAFAAGAAGYCDARTCDLESLARALEQVAQGRVLRIAPERPQPKAAPSPLAALTGREREVLKHVAGGADNGEIASRLGIAERTIRAHVSALYRKLGAENRTALALLARRCGVGAGEEETRSGASASPRVPARR